MVRKSTTRNAHGSGSIRKRKDGTWEARYTVGRDPGTRKQGAEVRVWQNTGRGA